jgi:hypothetical protein
LLTILFTLKYKLFWTQHSAKTENLVHVSILNVLLYGWIQ